jgi:hypothetical protein
MPTNIRIQDWTKEQLEAIVDAEDHASYDSAIKSLLKHYTIDKQMSPNANPDNRGTDFTHQSLTATDSLPAEEASDIWGPELYLGGTGTGKTVTAAYQLHRFLENEPQSTVFIVDPVGEYAHFTDIHGGKHVRYTHTDTNDQLDFSPSNRLHYCELVDVASHSDLISLEEMLDDLYEQAKMCDGRTVLLVDEAHRFLQSETTARLFEQMFRTCRKHGVSVQFVTQQLTEEIAATFVSLATRVYLHRLFAVDPDFADRVDLTQRQQEYVKLADTGATAKGAEVLVRDMSSDWQPFQVDIPADVLDQLVETPAEH